MNPTLGLQWCPDQIPIVLRFVQPAARDTAAKYKLMNKAVQKTLGSTIFSISCYKSRFIILACPPAI